MIAIDRYTAMKSVPAGAILNSIILQQRQSKASVARQASILPQRMNDLLSGSRRFTIELSVRLEKALGIEDYGFFYLHQAEHDIYLSKLTAERQDHPDLTKLTKTTFWDVNLHEINWHEGQRWAIRRVLEYGEPGELRELCRFYGYESFASESCQTDSFRLVENVKRNQAYLKQIHETSL